MKSSSIGNKLAQLGVLLCLMILLAASVSPQAQTTASVINLGFDPAQSKINWTLGATAHTVHGTFNLKRGSLRYDPATGKVSGEIVADATSGASGNDGRDKKMHKDVLESGRFSEIIFRPDSIVGKVAPQGESKIQLHGTFLLHGTEHELAVPVTASLMGDHWTGTGKFEVPFVDWGLKNPSNWLLKVDHIVNVELELKGTLQDSPAQ